MMANQTIYRLVIAVVKLERGGEFAKKMGLKSEPITGGRIARTSAISQATTYRYLPILVAHGFIKLVNDKRVNGVVKTYKPLKKAFDMVEALETKY